MTPLLLDNKTADAQTAPPPASEHAASIDSDTPVSSTSFEATSRAAERSTPRGSSIPDAARRTAIRNVRMMRVLDRIAVRFEAAGIPLMALKGAVLNMTVYDRPDQRPMDDLDLLIREPDIERTFALLEDMEGVRGDSLVRGDFFPRFHYEMDYTVGHIYPVRIDLHVRPFRPLRYSRVVPTDALWASARRMRIDKGVILVPSDEEMLIHLAAHAAIHACARRSWMVDLHRWVTTRPDALDWERFVDTADRWRLAWPVHRALVRAESELGPFLPADVLPSLAKKKVSWRDRLALRQAPRDAEHPVMHVLVSALTTPGLLFVLGYLHRVLIPSRAHMGDWYGRRHWGWLPVAHLARWLLPLLSRKAGEKSQKVKKSKRQNRSHDVFHAGRRTDERI